MEGLFEAFKYYLEEGQPMAYVTALAAGMATSFTPCVYPVIPVTIGYIGANAAGSRWKGFLLSLSYVLGIATTYSILGGAAALTGAVFGRISASPLSYFIVANICILLGCSMLGVFNLPVFSFFANMKPKAPGGGPSAFLVGLSAGLVVGPCTAPVLAVILAYVAAKKNLLYGATVLFTFAFGMGLLLIALGTFTGLLMSIPKAGPWLDRVKKAFGWVLILAGEYFLVMAGRLSI